MKNNKSKTTKIETFINAVSKFAPKIGYLGITLLIMAGLLLIHLAIYPKAFSHLITIVLAFTFVLGVTLTFYSIIAIGINMIENDRIALGATLAFLAALALVLPLYLSYPGTSIYMFIALLVTVSGTVISAGTLILKNKDFFAKLEPNEKITQILALAALIISLIKH